MISFTVMTVGTFDNFHEGHRALLKWCRRLMPMEGQLIVGLNSDLFVSQYKGRSVVQSWDERRKAILGQLLANQVVMNPQQREGDSMLSLLEEWRPDLLVVGDDWMGPHYLDQIGVTLDELWQLKTTLAFKPRGPNPVHSSDLRSDS